MTEEIEEDRIGHGVHQVKVKASRKVDPYLVPGDHPEARYYVEEIHQPTEQEAPDEAKGRHPPTGTKPDPSSEPA